MCHLLSIGFKFGEYIKIVEKHRFCCKVSYNRSVDTLFKERAIVAEVRVYVEVKVLPQDLPLSCPLPNMTLWNMHPKVYLAVNENNQSTCPYCSTHYIVTND